MFTWESIDIYALVTILTLRGKTRFVTCLTWPSHLKNTMGIGRNYLKFTEKLKIELYCYNYGVNCNEFVQNKQMHKTKIQFFWPNYLLYEFAWTQIIQKTDLNRPASANIYISWIVFGTNRPAPIKLFWQTREWRKKSLSWIFWAIVFLES